MKPGYSISSCPNCGATIERRFLRIEKSKLLIVEGKDEEQFFTAMIDYLQLGDVQVAGIGGKTKIRPELKALVKEPPFSAVSSLGVVRDADTDPEAAFLSVRDALAAARLPCPKKPCQLIKGPPKVHVMILPSPANKGSLEDVCLESIVNTPGMICAAEFFACLGKSGVTLPKQFSKAKVRAFLASKENPTLPLGLAATKGYWPFEHEAFKPLRQFLMSL